MSTSDMTEYLRVKLAERGHESGAKFMEDGFDRWAESTQPARMGQMEKMPSEPSMESHGGAMTVSMAKKYLQDKMGGRRRGELHGGFDLAGNFNAIKNGASQLIKFWREISKFLKELKTELQDEVVANVELTPQVREAGTLFLNFLKQLEVVQHVLDGIASMASYVGLGRHGGSIAKDFADYGKKVFELYTWIKKNGPGIRYILGMKSLNTPQPFGKEILKVIDPVLKLIGAGRHGGFAPAAKMVQERGFAPAAKMVQEHMGGRHGGRSMLTDMPMLGGRRTMLRDLTMSGGAKCQCPKRHKNGGTRVPQHLLEGPSLGESEHLTQIKSMHGGRKHGGRKHGGTMGALGRHSEEVHGERVVGGKAPSARGAIVSKIMREKGLSLPQASKYVKEHGLYGKPKRGGFYYGENGKLCSTNDYINHSPGC